jgi:uncharacterized membrane protein YciS (DUF1049 family)
MGKKKKQANLAEPRITEILSILFSLGFALSFCLLKLLFLLTT